jgi:hypothetical protein
MSALYVILVCAAEERPGCRAQYKVEQAAGRAAPVAPKVAGGALNDSDGIALPAGQATVDLALAVPSRHR